MRDALDELVTAQIVKQVAGLYGIAHRGFQAALTQGVVFEERARLHALIAELFARRGHEEFRRALHLLLAGESARGLEIFVAFAAHSQSITDQRPSEYIQLVDSLPDEWLDVYLRFITLCGELDRPAREVYLLRNRLVGLLNVMGAPSAVSHSQIVAHLRQLTRLSGIDDVAELPPSLDTSTRLRTALAAAQARFDLSSERERVIAPRQAITQLVRSTLATSGIAALGMNYELWEAVPQLSAFAALSPAIVIADKLNEGIGARIKGRLDDAWRIYTQLIARLDQPDRAGLEESNHRFTLCGLICGVGMIEAAMGLTTCTSWADAVGDERLHQVNALYVRMLNELWQGNVRDADELKDRVERIRIETTPRQLQDGLHFIGQLSAHANSDDLTRIKYVVDELRLVAQRHPGWIPVHAYAQGEYQRVRGDPGSALPHLQNVLATTRAGRHQVWAYAFGAYLRVLLALRDTHTAVARGRSGLEAAEHARLGYLTIFIKMPLALALAAAGESAEAQALADAVIEDLTQRGSRGLTLVLAYETRAQVAIAAKETASFEHYAHLCSLECRRAGSRVLQAKHAKLVRAAVTAAVVSSDAPPSHQVTTLTRTQLTSVLVGYDQASDRAERTLSLLLRASGARAGYLYLVSEHGPNLVAHVGDPPPDGLLAAVTRCIETELQERDRNTRSLELAPDAASAETHMQWHGDQAEHHQLVLLTHQIAAAFAITGVAALRVAGQFMHPGSLAAHLSRLLVDAGDVTPVLCE